MSIMHTKHWIDILIMEVDKGLRAFIPPQKRITQKPSPANEISEASLSSAEQSHVAGLMRVNHAGEVCAQALYQGQALTAQQSRIRIQMQAAAADEIDHLGWCEQRLSELGSKPSLLNLFWYSGSFLIGALAGWAGDALSLGFVAETERQVSKHLERHLKDLPQQDEKTKALLQQMLMDESQHAQMAIEAGAATLPFVIKQLMALVSKIMTKSSYYV